MINNIVIDYYDRLGFFGDGKNGVPMIPYNVHTNWGPMIGYMKDESTIAKTPLGHSDFDGNDVFDFTKPDHDFWDSPYNPLGIGKHFQSTEKAQKRVNDAIASCDKDDYENAMHSLQDSYSHYNAGYRWYPFHGWHPRHWLPGHAGGGTEPDNNLEAWNKANKATKANNQQWQKNCCKCGQTYNKRSTGPCE